jgi:ATP-dependent DNA helicase RecG
MNEAALIAKLNHLIQRGYEDEVVEFKEAKTGYDFRKLGKYFSALCNEANLKGLSDAWLVFGIRDKDKAYVNTQFRTNPSDLHSLKKEIADKTTHRTSFIEIYALQLPEGRVILFQIPAAPKGIPVAFDGHYYGREGESLAALSIEEIERIRTQGSIDDWSAKIVEAASIDDLCPTAIQEARNSYTKKFPAKAEDVAAWDDLTFLNKTKLCIRGRVTRTALLLVGKEESEHFLQPAASRITWILKDKGGVEKDYQHFGCPLIMDVQKVFGKIRFLKYRYMMDGSLFPEEVDQYDAYTVREALNNCIAHQDYTMGGKVTVTESEDGFLVFSNLGQFIPESIEEVITADAPESLYRNRFLADAMVNLGLIDTIGSGIKKLFSIQKAKFFPMPDYDLSDRRVTVKITGKVLDMNYARKLASMPDLSLLEIMALDKVVKKKPLAAGEIAMLRSKQLIEGRKPNFHISETIAKHTGDTSEYMKQRGIEDAYAEKMILDYLKRFKTAKRADIDGWLLGKLPEVLSEPQKKNKVKNLMQKLKSRGEIVANGRLWSLNT